MLCIGYTILMDAKSLTLESFLTYRPDDFDELSVDDRVTFLMKERDMMGHIITYLVNHLNQDHGCIQVCAWMAHGRKHFLTRKEISEKKGMERHKDWEEGIEKARAELRELNKKHFKD